MNLIKILFFMMSLEAPYKASSPLAFADSIFSIKQYDDAITEYKRYVYQDRDSKLLDSVYLQIALSYRYLGELDNSNKYLGLSLANTVTQNKVSQIIIDKAINQIIREDYQSASNILLNVLESASDTETIIQASYYLLIVDVLSCNFTKAKQRILDDYQRNSPGNHVYKNHIEIIALLDSVANLKHKDVKKAKRLSSFIPGFGQIYCKDCLKGVNAFILNGGMVALVTISIINGHYVNAILCAYFLQLFYFGNRYRTEIICNNYNKALDQAIQKAILTELSKPYWFHHNFK